MESSASGEETVGADSPAPNFSQVVFTDIPKSYPPSTPITCSYTITAAYQPNARDWLGIFKVGWNSTKDYHTFVWVEPCQGVVGQQSMTTQAVFQESYLPKDEIEFYQFCYVDSSGQVRGASTPFGFRNPEEQSLMSGTDDGLLVIVTQEQVDQSNQEKAELQKELDQIITDKETLKLSLQKLQQEADSWKGQKKEKEKENAELVKELDQVNKHSENLGRSLEQKQKESDQLKEEMAELKKQMQKLSEQKEQSHSLNFSRDSEEKYNRAVMKINQLKDERDEIKQKFDDVCEEMARLKAKLREGEREMFKSRDSIQLLQVDLQTSEKEKHRLAAELQKMQSLTGNIDEIKREKQELITKLSQKDVQQNPPDDLKVQCQTLSSRLQDTQAKLAAEKETTRRWKGQAEQLDHDLQYVRQQLEKVMGCYEQEQQKSSKYELQNKDTLEMVADKQIAIQDMEVKVMLITKEKDELSTENQKLKRDIEGLRILISNPASAAEPLYEQPDLTRLTRDASASQRQEEPIYQSTAPRQEEEPRVCRFCSECFPGITQEELEQHEQSHRVCPFCSLLCDNMDQSVFEDHVYSHEL
ncbi:calcium-binding and coiled-coil domain-containing protein 2 isoform 1-T2 [Pholidichthys leucotaenia]